MAYTHYVENVGKDDVIFIEVLQADHFSGEFSPSPKFSKILWNLGVLKS